MSKSYAVLLFILTCGILGAVEVAAPSFFPRILLCIFLLSVAQSVCDLSARLYKNLYTNLVRTYHRLTRSLAHIYHRLNHGSDRTHRHLTRASGGLIRVCRYRGLIEVCTRKASEVRQLTREFFKLIRAFISAPWSISVIPYARGGTQRPPTPETAIRSTRVTLHRRWRQRWYGPRYGPVAQSRRAHPHRPERPERRPAQTRSRQQPHRPRAALPRSS